MGTTRLVAGIRKEDKNRWEARAPLTPDDVRALAGAGVDVVVQPSPIRAFPDAAYAAAGARIGEDLSECGIVLGVKEMPSLTFRKDATYVFFAHVAKGQSYNMPMLRALLERGSSLVDYEKVVDEKGRRLIFFGRHAGLAGAIDTLWALGRRLLSEGVDTPLAQIEPAHRYRNLGHALGEVRRAGERISSGGLPESLAPMVIGVAGYGNVAGGAVEILEALGARDTPVQRLPALFAPGGASRNAVYRVTFREMDTVEPAAAGAAFDLAEFFAHPERYRGRFERFLPDLTVLLNCIYWDKRFPRLATKAGVRDLFSGPAVPRLRVIGDITCDVLGAVECNVGVTTPDAPVYVWNPATDKAVPGWEGRGPIVLAVDNLPCELPVESSTDFGKALMRFVPAMVRADWSRTFEELDLPREVKDAVIVYRGRLTPAYEYISGLW